MIRRVAEGFVVLGADEIGEHLRIAPASVSRRSPIIVIFGIAAHVDHAVDRACTAKDAPPRNWNLPSIQVRLRHCPVAPVQARRRERGGNQGRHVNEGMPILESCLDEADAVRFVLRQPVGKDAARCPSSDDYIVEYALVISARHDCSGFVCCVMWPPINPSSKSSTPIASASGPRLECGIANTNSLARLEKGSNARLKYH